MDDGFNTAVENTAEWIALVEGVGGIIDRHVNGALPAGFGRGPAKEIIKYLEARVSKRG